MSGPQCKRWSPLPRHGRKPPHPPPRCCGQPTTSHQTLLPCWSAERSISNRGMRRSRMRIPRSSRDPLPVFQAYAAYAPVPRRARCRPPRERGCPRPSPVAHAGRRPLSIDGRSVWFDSPEAKKSRMLCRYSLLASAPGWQVLARTADRCASPITVATLTTTAGAVVAVPQDLPPGIVTVSVSGVAQDLVSQVETGLYRAPIWWLTNGSARDRMVIRTADEPNILGAQPDDGWAGQLPSHETTIDHHDRAGGGDRGLGSALTVVFQVIPVTASP